jgi:hypothetical protein
MDWADVFWVTTLWLFVVIALVLFSTWVIATVVDSLDEPGGGWDGTRSRPPRPASVAPPDQVPARLVIHW